MTSLDEHNYESAVNLLQDRFGKPQQIISAHMEELLKISPCTGEKPSSFRYVFMLSEGAICNGNKFSPIW